MKRTLEIIAKCFWIVFFVLLWNLFVGGFAPEIRLFSWILGGFDFLLLGAYFVIGIPEAMKH